MFTQYQIGFRADRKDIWYSMDNSSTELEQVAQTQRTLCRSGWPRGFAELKPSPHSRIFTFVLVGSSPRSYLLTSVKVRIPAHTLDHTAPMCGTAPIQRVTLHFCDRREAASLRDRIRAEITYLCATRSTIQDGFRSGARAIWYSVNIPLCPRPFRLIRDHIPDKRNNTAVNQSSL